MSKIINGIKHPSKILRFFLRLILKRKISRLLPDKTYLKMYFYYKTGYRLNLKTPSSYNEKLQWLKLNSYTAGYSHLVDKYSVRSYIEDIIGKDYLIPLYGVFNNFDEIDFNLLPNEFVLKPNHTSGQVFICKDKKQINYQELKKEIDKWLKTNIYWIGREKVYKNIKPVILCEKLLLDRSTNELKDYKIYCFDGEPKIIQVDSNRFTNHSRKLFSPDWQELPFKIMYSSGNEIINKPKNLDLMLELSKLLSEELPHVRIDFYNISGKIYFGEITFYPEAGWGKIEPYKYDLIMGSYINLR